MGYNRNRQLRNIVTNERQTIFGWSKNNNPKSNRYIGVIRR